MKFYTFFVIISFCVGIGVFAKKSFSPNIQLPHPPKTQPAADTLPSIPISDGFDFPIGDSAGITEAKDGDDWYNANEFKNRRHLGEDWNANSGGNTDCREPVCAASKGVVVWSGDAELDWGNIVIIRHTLPNGTSVETLYAHLDERLVERGDIISRRQVIGFIGDGRTPCGDGYLYPAHLHFEIRLPHCRGWGRVAEGYSDDPTGWTDPSDFINGMRRL